MREDIMYRHCADGGPCPVLTSALCQSEGEC